MCELAVGIQAQKIEQILGGKQMLGRTVSNDLDLALIVRSGLPFDALESLIAPLGLSSHSISESLAIPKETLARRKRQARLTADESDRVCRPARIVVVAEDVFRDRHKASRWLRRPNRALGSVTPLSLLDTDAGTCQVEAVLMRIANGIIS